MERVESLTLFWTRGGELGKESHTLIEGRREGIGSHGEGEAFCSQSCAATAQAVWIENGPLALGVSKGR